MVASKEVLEACRTVADCVQVSEPVVNEERKEMAKTSLEIDLSIETTSTSPCSASPSTPPVARDHLGRSARSSRTIP